jgi:hypothetical protein
MNPTMMATIALAIRHLDKNHSVAVGLWSRLPYYPKPAKGYVRHLQALILLVRRKCKASESKAEKAIVIRNAMEQSHNPLHLYLAGNLDAAIFSLNNFYLWPNDRLPTGDICSQAWPMQRDRSELKAGDASVVHSGGDFAFMAKIILDEVSGKW